MTHLETDNVEDLWILKETSWNEGKSSRNSIENREEVRVKQKENYWNHWGDLVNINPGRDLFQIGSTRCIGRPHRFLY